MPGRATTTLLALLLCAGLAGTSAAFADAPTGQFQPSTGDRDGDGLADGDDCAADDPSRPALSGPDSDCDGSVDDPAVYSADSQTPVATATLRAAARRAAQVPVVASPGTVGPAVLFAPREAQPLLVFTARQAMRVSVTPTLVYADGRRAKVPHSWSAVGRGMAWAFRMRPSSAARIELAIRVRDVASGTLYRASRSIAGS